MIRCKRSAKYEIRISPWESDDASGSLSSGGWNFAWNRILADGIWGWKPSFFCTADVAGRFGSAQSYELVVCYGGGSWTGR